MNKTYFNLKVLQTCLFLLFAFTTSAQKIQLAYEPKGKVVKFYFDSLTIYTDTSALFSVYDKDSSWKAYDLSVKNLVRKSLQDTKSDTVMFAGDFIPFTEISDPNYQKNWSVEWAILELLSVRKLKMYDKHGMLVTTIIARKVGRKKDNFVKRSYINKATKEELLAETLFIRTITPKF
jgi:hypothetical protein